MSVPAGRSNLLYEEFARASLSKRAWSLVSPRTCEHAFLEEFYRQQNDKRAAGFKLMYSQVARHPGAWEWILRGDVRMIHLVREDALRVILSRLTRLQTGVAHASRQIGPALLKVDPKRLIKEMGAREQNLQRFRSLMTDRPHVIEVRYEDYLDHPHSENRTILEFLGVSPDTELRSGVVKQKTYALREIIENYDDLLDAVKGTPYMRFLHDPKSPQTDAESSHAA